MSSTWSRGETRIAATLTSAQPLMNFDPFASHPITPLAMLSPSISSYEVGWICALPHELAAARGMLDEDHGVLQHQEVGDNNTYAIGRIHQHNVVIACLPAGIDGTCAAATVAQNMMRTFPQIRVGLLVGIGGGIPDLEKGVDIRLGDVVVSQPDGEHGGVIQYAKGKIQQNKNTTDPEFFRKGSLNKPPLLLLNALAMLQAHHEADESKIPTYIEEMLQRKPKMRKTGYGFPGVDHDHLFRRSATKKYDTQLGGQSHTTSAKDYVEVTRPPRVDPEPAIHYGNIASGDFVVKNDKARDALRNELGVKCVEMEAAGLQDSFPCLVIRGICDYADKFKNGIWHRYAAMTAAAYAKEFLLYISPLQVHRGQTAQEVTGQLDKTLKEGNRLQEEALEENRAQFQKMEAREQTQYENKCLRVFKTSKYERFKDINPDRVTGTCRWVLDHPQFRRWHDSADNDLLWISADPGCGKSVLCKSLIDHELAALPQSTTCYYFFKDNAQQDRLAPALCAVLHQLFSDQPHLLRHAIPSWERNGEKIQEEIETMWRILLDATSDEMASAVVCVFDALDECHDQDLQDLVARLCRFYEQSSQTTGRATLKFLTTSRPYDKVQRWFTSRPPLIRLRGENENDSIHDEINQVIDQQLQDLALEFNLSPHHQDQLGQRLRSMEHRTYLWLYLAMEEIRNRYRDSPDPEEESFDYLPVSVENAYETILQRITNSQRSLARKILVIVVGARRPLTIGEASLAINAAAAYENDRSFIKRPNTSHLEGHVRDWCGLFVFINHSQLFLIHQTAKDFLLTDIQNHNAADGLWKASLLTADVEREMAIMCVTYLYYGPESHQSPDHNIDDQSAQSEFFKYCATYWTSHLCDHDITEHPKLLKDVLDLYDSSQKWFPLWYHVWWKTSFPTREVPRLTDQHVISTFGHAVVLAERYKTKTFDVDEVTDDNTGTALGFAAEKGSKEIVRLLLDKGANVNLGGKHSTPLLTASAYGHEEIVQILLDNGADVNASAGDYGTAIDAAMLNGHTKIEQMLRDRGAIVNTDETRACKALILASRLGHLKIVQMLRDRRGMDFTIDRECRRQALLTATANGHTEIVQMLRDMGVDE